MIATVDDFKPWHIERSKVERCLCTKFGLSAWLSNVVWVCIAKINPSQPTTDKLPTTWGDGKAEVGTVTKTKKRREEERRLEQRKGEKKEDAGARKGIKVVIHCVFPMICGSGGSKSRLAKAARAEPAGQMRDEKLHAVVARSTFRSQNVQNTPFSDHFWKLRCRKSARRCGAKHISN